MKFGLKLLLTAGAVGVLTAAVLAPVAGAASSPTGMMPTPMPTSSMMPTPMPLPSSTAAPGGWCGGGMWNGSGAWGGTGMWGMGPGMAWLTSNPAALQAWLQLRADRLKALQTWQDTYKDDLSSGAAQQALHDLWTTMWNDMKTLCQQYGNGAMWTSPSEGMWGGWQMGSMMNGRSWDASHMWGSGYGAAWMMSHPGGFGQWLAMRAKQTGAMMVWQRLHNADPASSAATHTLRTLRMHQRLQVRSFYQRHHLSATTTRMRYGAGGWMGLGGIWGGFGW
jgi:hypothetical protein